MGKKAQGPKRIAGVKVPKRLRGPIGTASKLLQNPIVADLIAAGLAAAAAALRENEKVRKAAGAAKHTADDAAHDVGSGAGRMASVIAATVREGARVIEESYLGANGSGGSGSASPSSAKGKPGKKTAKSSKKK